MVEPELFRENAAVTIGSNGFVRIPPGTYVMGSPDDEMSRRRDEAAHPVVLSREFHLARYPITVGEFAEFVEDSGYVPESVRQNGAYCWADGTWRFESQRNWRTPGFPQSSSHPVTCISWHDVAAYCVWLNEGDREQRVYRLPSEAEWEYACRAGSTTAWNWGDSAEDGYGRCNVADQAGNAIFEYWEGADWDSGFAFTSPVNEFPANKWGLYDMHGNVWEWCADWWYGPYPSQAVCDSCGPGTGTQRVIRGGSWHHVLARGRSAARFKFPPDYCNVCLGGRICFAHGT